MCLSMCNCACMHAKTGRWSGCPQLKQVSVFKTVLKKLCVIFLHLEPCKFAYRVAK